MATLFRSKKTGLTRIQFNGPDGKRKTISLGRCPIKQAERLLPRIEALAAAARYGGTLDDDTQRFLADASDALHEKLTAAGLSPPRSSTTLKPFVDEYIRESTVKESTKTVWRRARRLLVKCFGPGKPLREFTAGDAKDFRKFLLKQPGHGPKDVDGNPPRMAEGTIRTMCSRVKQFFEDAVDRRLIDRNPFKHKEVPTASTGNRSRQHFIPRDDTAKVLAAAPDAEWRLLIALTRYGGLRHPSETLSLCWGDVDWSTGRFVVKASKTEHHDGKGVRIVPLFPELVPYLEAVFDEAPAGTRHVIAHHRNANHRTLMRKIIKRAGLVPWPKLFQNLRSTRQTELEETFPRHVVCAWIGNSAAVAEKHYLQVTDDHFERALTSARCTNSPQGPRRDSQREPKPRKTRRKPHSTRTVSQKVGDEGLEPPTLSV